MSKAKTPSLTCKHCPQLGAEFGHYPNSPEKFQEVWVPSWQPAQPPHETPQLLGAGWGCEHSTPSGNSPREQPASPWSKLDRACRTRQGGSKRCLRLDSSEAVATRVFVSSFSRWPMPK